jgi:hypothetical protein
MPTVDINTTAAAIPATLIFPFRIVSPPWNCTPRGVVSTRVRFDTIN